MSAPNAQPEQPGPPAAFTSPDHLTFVIDFAQALTRLRDGVAAGTWVMLNPPQAKALLDAMKLLQQEHR